MKCEISYVLLRTCLTNLPEHTHPCPACEREGEGRRWRMWWAWGSTGQQIYFFFYISEQLPINPLPQASFQPIKAILMV